MNTFKNHWAVFGFDVDSLEVGQGADSRVFTEVGNIDELEIVCGFYDFIISNFILKFPT